MKRVLLFAALALQGCDWDAAERLARCNAGELPCDAGLIDSGVADAGALDAGGLDAGSSDAGFDAGSSDAGFDAGSSDAGLDAGAPMTTVGLYPNVTGAWHVFNEGGRGVVHVIDGGVSRETRLSGMVVQAYADSPRSHWLALLVDAGTPQLVVVDAQDGGTIQTGVSGADLLSVYVTPATVPAVSLWSSALGTYRQEILVPSGGTFVLMGGPMQSTCDITFDDLEVLAPPADRVVIAYRSGSCGGAPGSPSEGVIAQTAGIQSITPAGNRGSVTGHVTGVNQRVGRSGNGFNIATQDTAIHTSKFVWGQTSFSVTACGVITPAGGAQLQLGDVSDGVVTGLLLGDVTVGMNNATLSTTVPTVFAAHVCDTSTPWVVPLGPGVVGARVPVLVQGSRVLVSVQRPDGGVELLNRDLSTGD